MIASAVVCAVACGLGLTGVVAVATGAGVGAPGVETRRHHRPGRSWGRSVRRLLLPCALGGLAVVATGWPVAFPIGALAAWGLPVLFGRTSGSVSVERVEAIAAWTEMLHGTLAASAGLSQAIMATAPLAPAPIREPVLTLSARLRAGTPPATALVALGDELDDPCADRVICALLLAASARAQRLGDLLAALADSTRDEVALRLRVETSRASVRSGIRTVIVFSVAFAALLSLLARAYLAPFGSVTGQLVLVGVGVLYAAGLTLMVTMSRPPEAIRLLGGTVDAR